MEEEDLADGDLSAVKPGYFEQCKLVSSPIPTPNRFDSRVSTGPCCTYRPQNDVW